MSEARKPQPEAASESPTLETSTTRGEGVFDAASAPDPLPSITEVALTFPQYEMIGPLGRGGMGLVYQARQRTLNRRVALKLLPLGFSQDLDFVARFQREAHAMARLNHPNIIAIYDSGQTVDGQLYMVMEFVDGTNLHELIASGSLEATQALSIAAQICDALAYAHGEGVVHRDLKPANIMVDFHGRAKVGDFGLARLASGELAEATGLTQTGMVIGTLDYMAPEQRRGERVDHRADIFSLGVVLYEMLCREVPRGVFDLPSKRVGCDARLDTIVAAAIQNAPESRYQSAQEMRAAIEGARSGMGIRNAPAPSPTPRPGTPPSPRPRRARRKKALLAAGICVVFAALLGGIVFWLAGKTDVSSTPIPPPPPPAPADVSAGGSGARKEKPVVEVPASPAKTDAFTLSDEAIVSLDDTRAEGYFQPPLAATITARRRRPAGGVELDIHFPGTGRGDYSLHLTSNQRGTGAKALAGLDVSRFQEYQLKLTILSADGSKTASPSLSVGALIGPDPEGHGYTYNPFRIGLSSTPSVILNTKGFVAKPSLVGLMISLHGGNWPEGPHDVTVLAEPVEGATAVDPIKRANVNPAKAGAFTLSDKAIISLDDTKAEWAYQPAHTATITARRQRPEGGVELDIHFPSTASPDYSLELTSNAWTGAKTLAGLEVSAFEEYQIKFTILAADGSRTTSPNLTVGALLGPTSSGSKFGFRPLRIGLSSTPSGISSTKSFAPKVSVLGLEISLYGGQWPEGPHDVTILVQAPDGATPLPK